MKYYFRFGLGVLLGVATAYVVDLLLTEAGVFSGLNLVRVVGFSVAGLFGGFVSALAAGRHGQVAMGWLRQL